ncbi:unnamed protein product [Brassica rapa subsp. trilocularis]
MVVLLDGVTTLALLKSKDVLLVTELSLSVETKPSFSVIDFVYRWRRRSRRRRRSSPRRRRRWRSVKYIWSREQDKGSSKRRSTFGFPSTERSSKRRKGEDGPQSSTAHANEDVAGETVERPPGVKASKRSGKKPMEEGKGREEVDRVWAYKQQDLSRREKLSKIGLLDRLLARTEPLPDYEETLKKKLINELFSS